MKKLWIVLLSAAMLMAFVMPAAAADLKVSGSYYVEGVYRNNPTNLDKENSTYNSGLLNSSFAASKALYFQRLRVQPEVNVVEGLKLVMRFDAMEKRWGDQTWDQASAAVPYDVTNRMSSGDASARTQENIEWERAYVDFNTAIGRFLIGYQEFGAFGTVFVDTSFSQPGMKYFVPFGPVTAFLAYDKQKEKEVSAGVATAGKYADLDKDEYYIGAIYKQGDIEAGIQFEYLRDAANRSAAFYTAGTAPSTMKLWLIDPYFKGKFGPVFVEAEGFMGGGKLYELENASNTFNDVDLRAWGLYLHARVDISMFYGGFMFAWVSGDDPSTADKIEGTVASQTGFSLGQNWSPTLIFKNDDHATYTGGVTGALSSANAYGGTSVFGGSNATNQFMDNIWFYQLYFGVKPTPKWDISAKISYAYADKKPWQTPATLGVIGATGDSTTEYVSNKYGTEVDLIASYKIYDNLTYMVGFGYFWVGDYYKGYYTAANEPKLENDYLFMHRLTLTF